MATGSFSRGPVQLQASLRSWLTTRGPVTLSGMMNATADPNGTRHRILEGVLLRLARRSGGSGFVLRGGLLLRHWFRPVARPADDLDLIAPALRSADDASQRILPALADASAADGVTFDLEGARVEGIFLDTGSPGARVFASGTFDEAEEDFHIDITFGPAPRPAPVFGALPTACGAEARVWACRPEAIVGQKVQALHHLGTLGWRQKDLNDLHLLLTRVPMNAADLRTAVAAYLADLGATLDAARALFGPDSWWAMKLSSARWSDFVGAARGQGVPRNLARVVAEVGARLIPMLEGS